MAGFDVPHITHDMILRFMGVNFSSITDGSARIPSSLGDEKKPVPILEAEKKPSSVPVPVGKTPEQDKAMWEGSSRPLYPSPLFFHIKSTSLANVRIRRSVLQCWLSRARARAYRRPCRRLPLVAFPEVAQARPFTVDVARGAHPSQLIARGSR